MLRRKMVVLGKRKMLWTAVLLIGVMGPLFAASYTVPVQDVTGQAEKMLTYRSDREGIELAYPPDWLLRTERNYGGEIIETVSFTSPDQAAHGFVQVMQLGRPVPEYIREAEKRMVPGYDSLEFKQTTAGDKAGWALSYKRGSGAARTVAAEYFFERPKKVYRFSCFYPETGAEEYAGIFDKMLAGFKLPAESPPPGAKP